jgi:integrase
MVFRLYVLPRFGDVPLDVITQREVRAWVTSLTVKGLAPATVHKAYQLFAKTMTAAVDGGMLAQTPCRGVPLPKVEHEEMRYLNPVEVACLAEAIRPGYRALVFVGAYGGLRIGELAGLRRSRVDLDAGTVDVAETVVEVEGRLLFGPPKTRAGRRRIGLPRRVVDELALHLRAPGRPTDPVFRSPAGGPLRVAAFRNRIWRPVCLGCASTTSATRRSPCGSRLGPPPRRSRSGPGTPRPASCWTATATCSPSPMQRYATAWTSCSYP